MAAKQDILYLQSLLDKYGINADINGLLEKWCEPHRFYHNISHLDDLLQQITTSFRSGDINEQQKEQLELTAIFHDIVYDAARRDNEEQSAQYFLGLCSNADDVVVKDVHTAILDTQTHNDSTPLATLFNRYDLSVVEQDFNGLLQWENGIYNEYKVFGDIAYKLGRLQFLETLPPRYPQNKNNLEQLIAWVIMNY